MAFKVDDLFNFGGIHPIEGEPGRFLVDSDTPGEPPYLVDLSEFEGNGECSCADFNGRRRVNIREMKPLFTRWTSCKHLIRVRNMAAIAMFNDFAKRIKAVETEKTPF